MSENNNIPRHWQVKKLGEVCQVLDNLRKPINSAERQQRIAGKKQSELFPYYGATGQVGWIDDYITDGQYILIGEDGAPFLDIFKDKAYKISGKTWVNNHAHILKGKENLISDEFVLYHLNSINYANFVNGTTRLKLTKSSLVEIPIFLPPLPEQLAIVSKIEELLSDLENGKQQLLTAQQQLKVYRQSLLKAAFDGRLTNEGVNEGVLPEGWKWVKLMEVSNEISDGDHQAPPKSNEGIPFITISNVNKNTNKIDFTETFKVDVIYYSNLKYNRKPQKGDVLYTVTGSFGIPILIDFDKEFCFQRHIGLIRPKEIINQKWLFYLLQSPNIYSQAKNAATGTAQKTVSLSSLRNFEIPYCTLSEQHQIVEILESKLTICDKIAETISQSLLQADTLKQSILKKAFEGKLV